MKKHTAIVLILSALFLFVSSAQAAVNPFADVPAGHWAYDAVAQLSADGLISGYPNSLYNGGKICTRYELASAAARAFAKAEETKAAQRDLDLLKKLAAEFGDELGALGVKTDKLDGRLSLLEERLGGWKLSGSYVFDANFSGKGWYNATGGKNEFDTNHFDLNIMKFIDRDTFFMGLMRYGFLLDGSGRGDVDKMTWIALFINTKLPGDIDFRVGRWFEDFELWNGLYWANYEMNSLFGSYRMDGFRLHKSWGAFEATAIAARNSRYDNMMLTILGGGYIPDDTAYGDYMHYVLNLQWQPGERFKLGGLFYRWDADGGRAKECDLGFDLAGAYADIQIASGVNLKGIYYWQKLDKGFTRLPEYSFGGMRGAADENPTAWKAVLDVKQDIFKWTSLWLEYSVEDNSFSNSNQQHVMNWTEREYTPAVSDNRPYGWDGSTKMWMAGAEQRWNDKWTTLEKYARADYGQPWADDAWNVTVGVTYQYTPAVHFQLVYDYIDYGDGVRDPMNARTYRSGSDHVLKFRTGINF